MSKEDQKMTKVTNSTEYNRPSYKDYIEYNEGFKWTRENINIDQKSDIVEILIPKNDTESLSDKLLIDVKFPPEYTFSIAGRKQIQDIEEFDQLFTFQIKACDNNKKELSPESRIFIHKEKEIDQYIKNVTRLESPFYKDVSITKFCKIQPDSLKTIDELYKFSQGVEFNRNEHLCIYVVDSDIDINPKNVEFNINLDKWDHQSI